MIAITKQVGNGTYGGNIMTNFVVDNAALGRCLAANAPPDVRFLANWVQTTLLPMGPI